MNEIENQIKKPKRIKHVGKVKLTYYNIQLNQKMVLLRCTKANGEISSFLTGMAFPHPFV